MPDRDNTVRRSLLIYLCVVVVTALLWLVVTLSERHVYRVAFRLEWVGVDSAQYVVTHADRTVSFDVMSNGFFAISRNRLSRRESFMVDVRRDTSLTAVACVEALRKQFNLQGVYGITFLQPRVSIGLAQRHVKGFVPQLRELNVNFDDPYALYGTISVSPDTVWLYGSESSLACIDHVETQPATLANVRQTHTYQLALNPTWSQYSDVRVSTPNVSVTIPTARFAERSVTLPLVLEGAPKGLRAHLYPSQVTVSLWVTEQDFARLSTDQIRARVQYDPSADVWKVAVVSFPSYVRIRSVEPEAVRYVIIQS